MVRGELCGPVSSGFMAKPAVRAALQGMGHLRSKSRHGGHGVAGPAYLIGAVSMVRGELGGPASSGLVAKPAVSAALQGMGHLRGDRLRDWSPGRGGRGVAHLAVRAGALSVISGELGCSGNSGSMARPTVGSTLQGMGHLRGECCRGGCDVAGLADINGQAVVIVRNARRVLDTHLVARQAFLTTRQVVRNGWRGGSRWSRLRKKSMARRTPFYLQQVVAVRWHGSCSRSAVCVAQQAIPHRAYQLVGEGRRRSCGWLRQHGLAPEKRAANHNEYQNQEKQDPDESASSHYITCPHHRWGHQQRSARPATPPSDKSSPWHILGIGREYLARRLPPPTTSHSPLWTIVACSFAQPY